VAKYNKELAGNEIVEFIQVSLDRDEDAALEWAIKENFPWLQVMKESASKADLSQYHTSGSVPFYCLIDKEGKVVAKGSQASFSMAKDAAR
jgi:hypothetical protein